jgi:hypothetical protein
MAAVSWHQQDGEVFCELTSKAIAWIQRLIALASRARPHARPLFFQGSMANLPAHGVFRLVERFLLGGRNVAVVELRHRPLFLADRVILAVKLAGLAFRDFAFPQLAIDAPVLVLQAIVDLGAPRMIFLPLCLGHGVCHGDAAAFAAWLMGCPFSNGETSRAATPAEKLNTRFMETLVRAARVLPAFPGPPWSSPRSTVRFSITDPAAAVTRYAFAPSGCCGLVTLRQPKIVQGSVTDLCAHGATAIATPG